MNRAHRISIGGAVLSAAGAMAACSPQADAPPGGDDAHRQAAAALHAVPEGVLLASSGVVDENLGYSVDISGDTAILGANGMTARAVVFTRSGGTWTEQAELDLPSPCINGCPVAIEADTALVGVPNGGVGGGLVVVFTRSGAAWTKAQEINPEQVDYGQFGFQVALEGDTAVVGARINNNSKGSAVVYVRDGLGMWKKNAKLSGTELLDIACGTDVALSGDTILVGCPPSDDKKGAAYVYVRSNGQWMEQERLTGNDVDPNSVGTTVALSGNIAALGSNSGTYVLARSGGAWTHEKKLFTFAPVLSGEALFGHNGKNWDVHLREGGAWSMAMSQPGVNTIASKAVDGTTVVVGTPAYMAQGAAHVFLLELDKGDACGPVAPCVGGFCVDGVCCETECGGGDPNDCMACSVAAGGLEDGVCGPLACDDGDACTQTDILDCSTKVCMGGNPVVCPKPQLACAIAGVCDTLTGVCSSEDTSNCVDATTCAGAVPGMPCAPSRCVGTDEPTKGIGAAYCIEGQDACPVDEAPPFDCSPFVCEPADGACRASCTSPSHCAPGLVCGSTGKCVPKPPSKVGDAGGCTFRAAGAGGPGGLAAWLSTALAAVGLGLFRRGRRGASCHLSFGLRRHDKP